MSLLKLYLDEDAMSGRLVKGLRFHGLDVVTATDIAMVQQKDVRHLAVATEQERVLYSFNVADFQAIHSEWTSRGNEHFGIVLCRQKRYNVGEQIRRLAHLAASITAEEMRNRLEFLGNW